MTTSEDEFKEYLKEDADTICNCIYMHAADEYESCWYDCSHPQRPAISCPYHKMKECPLAVPDVESQEFTISMATNANKFWEKERELDEKKEHICEITDEELKERHKNVLSLIGIHDPIRIGTLIAGKYYKDVWSSRSCSGKLSRLVGGDDYMDFYCGSSLYYAMNKLGSNDIRKDFEDMDTLDQANRE